MVCKMRLCWRWFNGHSLTTYRQMHKKSEPLITSNNNTNYMQKLCVAEDYTQRKLVWKQRVPKIQQNCWDNFCNTLNTISICYCTITWYGVLCVSVGMKILVFKFLFDVSSFVLRFWAVQGKAQPWARPAKGQPMASQRFSQTWAVQGKVQYWVQNQEWLCRVGSFHWIPKVFRCFS